MRAALVAVATLFLLQATTALPLVERHRVGVVEVGMPEQKLIDAFPANRREFVDLRHEGMPSPAWRLRWDGATRPDALVAELEPAEGPRTVWRIQVRDPAFRTAKGIGIGSTVGQLRAAYRLDNIVSGEGNVAIVVDTLSASFTLDQRGAGGDGLWKLRSPAAVPDAVKIIGILLFP
jgi:hypothetical protein